jgi:uncharacterized membrane protein
MSYVILKFFHVLGAIVLLGTGSGIAFFMLMAHRSGHAGFIARTAGVVVIADAIFTASAVLAQPVTGYFLLRATGHDWNELWVVAALTLFVVAGLFWLPVVWFQMRLRDLAAASAAQDQPLPEAYHRLFRIWFAFGFPGFGAALAILWLMIARPGW